MTEDDKSSAQPGDDIVGYGRPPVETRFKPGKSGNPRGRPKGIKTIGKLFAEALARQVTVQESGRPRKIRMQDLIIQGLVNDAARREPRAVQLLFSLLDRYGDGRDQEIDAEALSSEDGATLNRYLASVQAKTQEITRDALPSPDIANGEQPLASGATPSGTEGRNGES